MGLTSTPVETEDAAARGIFSCFLGENTVIKITETQERASKLVDNHAQAHAAYHLPYPTIHSTIT